VIRRLREPHAAFLLSGVEQRMAQRERVGCDGRLMHMTEADAR